MGIAERVKESRKKKGITQAQLASMIGVSQQSIQKIEKGTSKSSTLIVPIASVLGVPPTWLQFGTKEPKDMQDVYASMNPEYVPILEWHEVLHWCVPDEEPIEIDRTKRKFIANPNPSNKSGQLFALRIKNDVMTSPIQGAISFPPGSIIIADPGGSFTSGKYVLGVWENTPEAIFRQLVVEAGVANLKPLNPQYETQKMTTKFLLVATVITRMDILP